MKKTLFAIVAILSMVFATGAFACSGANCLNLGGSTSNSQFDQATPNVVSGADSFHAVGVVGSGVVSGYNAAGGQAVTTHNVAPLTSVTAQHQSATQNVGEAYGEFGFNIATGNKNFLWIIPPVAGAIAGTAGNTAQFSVDATSMSNAIGDAGSRASQDSAAGFAGADAGLLIGKNKHDSGAFSGDAFVTGESYSTTYKIKGPDTKIVGTMSGAANSAQTVLSGGFGTGYAGGQGQTAGQSAITTPLASTSGSYSGQFCYQGNGSGNVSGFSESYKTKIGNYTQVGTSSGVSVNVNPN